jgi:hypothetical protein
VGKCTLHWTKVGNWESIWIVQFFFNALIKLDKKFELSDLVIFKIMSIIKTCFRVLCQLSQSGIFQISSFPSRTQGYWRNFCVSIIFYKITFYLMYIFGILISWVVWWRNDNWFCLSRSKFQENNYHNFEQGW